MSEEDVVVLGGVAQRNVLPGVGPIATAGEIVASAEVRGAGVLAEAEARAAAILAEAHATAAAITANAREQGIQQGLHEAEREAEQLLGLLREAASEGVAIRDQVAGEAMSIITRAVLVAVRRIVGEFYDDDPARTVAAVSDALRSASGQEIVSIRVNPTVEPMVKAALVDVTNYIRPDEGIAVGGCVIDLRNGLIDAALDSRLSLMELAIQNSAGEVIE